MDPCLLSLTEQARLLVSGEMTSAALTEAHLDRIAWLDPDLHAFITVDADGARRAAAGSDARRKAGGALGPLDGLTVGIKDLIDVAGLPTTAAAAHRRDHRAEKDAPVITALRRAGAMIVGKTTTAEYAVGGTALDGPYPGARNPWNRECDAASSSSGSAVAVVAGLAAGAVGTETAGSIRVPAAWCGAAGLVPTQALISRQGVLPLSRSLDCIGPMARTAADCAILLQAMITDDPADRATPGFRLPDPQRIAAGINGLRIGIPRHVFEDDPDLSNEVRAAFSTTLDHLRDLGCLLVDVTLAGFDLWADAARKISWPEEYAEHGEELQTHPDRFGAVTRSRLQEGLTFTAPDHVLALRQRKAARASLSDTFGDVDLLALPTAKTVAQPFGYEHGPNARDLTYGRPFNLVGAPMLTLCNGFSRSGLPLAVQFIARPFNEDLLLGVGISVERALRSKPDLNLRHFPSG
jgi:aspartyl-tRNA(Asn)/glutamyl-tRNA(Gln) amidotransferase subunit A